jgi:hypothetical protein
LLIIKYQIKFNIKDMDEILAKQKARRDKRREAFDNKLLDMVKGKMNSPGSGLGCVLETTQF